MVIDKQEIVISSIDKNRPTIVFVERVGGTCEVIFDNPESGLNFASIIYYYDGVVSNNYTYDVNKNAVCFPYYKSSDTIIYIEDDAGNWTKVTINENLW